MARNTLKRGMTIFMVMALIITAMAIPASAASDSVDHIDIGVKLTADIMIDGKLYEDLSYTLEKSDLNSSNLTISASTGTFSYNLKNVSSSTGSSGIQQHRISGNFPVGTKAAPVRYTVRLTKTVEVNTDSGVVKVPVTFEATFGYWDSDNDCPGLRNGGRNNRGTSWADGGIVSGSGLDFLLGNAEEDVNTKGTITIQKTVEGLTLAEGETKAFTFDIYAADNTLYKTISATVSSDSPYATTSISEVPFGTYFVVERNAAAEGYVLATEYKVGANGTETADASATFELSKTATAAAVYVTNSYAELPPPETEPPVHDLTVEKKWEDLLPNTPHAPIEIQLYENGEAYGEPVTLSDANGWTATYTGLLDSSEWTLEELNVPDHYVPVISWNGMTSATVTNIEHDDRIGDAYVSVHKYWNDNGNPDRPTEVTVQLLVDGAPYGDPAVLSDANNWTHKWYELNPEKNWTVIELNVPEGYTVDIQKDGLYFHITNSMDYQPPATEPPATEPPATEPPATEPPATEPPATEPPATEPPATEPPATEPPATEPPATEPPATKPSGTEEDIDIIDEPVPLSDSAEVPQTGGPVGFWAVLSMVSGLGLIGISLKKKGN